MRGKSGRVQALCHPRADAAVLSAPRSSWRRSCLLHCPGHLARALLLSVGSITTRPLSYLRALLPLMLGMRVRSASLRLLMVNGPASPRGHQPHPTGGPGHLLLIGSHNVGGRMISDRHHARATTDLWRRERLDVVALQETFVDASNKSLASKYIYINGITRLVNT